MADRSPLVHLKNLGVLDLVSFDAGSTPELDATLAALRAVQSTQRAQGILRAPDDRMGALMQSWLAQQPPEPAAVSPVGAVSFEATLDARDWTGWAKSFFTWVGHIVPHGWLPPADAIETVATDPWRIALLGDWGTGLYGAPVCAASIQTTKPAFDLLLHLGDVYYSGMPSEVEDRFLNLWPDVAGAKSRALNSNHEMYSGGYGYFGRTLPRFGQRSSAFAMQNAHWLLIGLDTGYAEHDLANDQGAWVMRRVEEAGDRKIVLFSHHQPCSLFEKQGPKVVSALQPLLASKKVVAWYWGHEHRCVIYDRHPQFGFAGRCIGHSGFPYDRDKFGAAKVEREIGNARWMRMSATAQCPGGLALDGPNRYVTGFENDYGPNGYATLELMPDRLVETVRDPDGVELWRSEIR